MRRAVLSAVVVAAVVVAGCSKPTESVIPSDMSKWDTDLAPVLKKLPEEDRKLVAGYLMRAKLGEAFGGKGGMPIGTTVGDAIEQQKAWQAEQAKKEAEALALKERLQREQAEAIAAIDKAVTVTLLAKKQLPANFGAGRYSEYQMFVVGVENKGEKEIAGVAGELKFIDVFDREVGSVNFSISEHIKPGGTFKWEGGRNYNQFIDSHKAVWGLEEGKYKTTFQPFSIVYTDGTKLIAPKN